MEELIEILIELVLEGSLELLKSKKVPKWIRVIIGLIFISIIIGLIALGLTLLKETIIGGIIIMSVGLFMLIGITLKIKKYLKQ